MTLRLCKPFMRHIIKAITHPIYGIKLNEKTKKMVIPPQNQLIFKWDFLAVFGEFYMKAEGN
ncbi:hypothetical protein VN23_02515 [Janthinobacterium sp. B9-8]|nr:hypothetical protein VN23_02515 [Janthinobacterium sp. B9-8]